MISGATPAMAKKALRETVRFWYRLATSEGRDS
jgi:hypothetical protein